MIFLALTMLLGITAQASGPIKSPEARPILSFDRTTAICTVYIRGNSSTDTIKATVKLLSGLKCLAEWKSESIGSVKIKESHHVSKGRTYKLTVDYTVNGIKQPQSSVTRTCP